MKNLITMASYWNYRRSHELRDTSNFSVCRDLAYICCTFVL